MWIGAIVGGVIGAALGLVIAAWVEAPKYDALPDTFERRRMNIEAERQ